MNVLLLDCGNSSIKFQVIATDLDRIEKNSDERLAHGIVEFHGGKTIVTLSAEGKPAHHSTAPLRDTRAAVKLILNWVISKARFFITRARKLRRRRSVRNWGVQAVLLGRVGGRGDDLKLNLELVNTNTQNVIWIEEYVKFSESA